MTRVRYIAQIYPPLDECVRRLKTISWYVWGGEIFRVPLSTLQNRKGEGGWDLTHIIAKSCALFLYRLRQQGVRSGTLTAEWLRLWVLMAQNKNRPHRRRKPVPLEYLRRYAVDVAYVTQQGSTEWQSTNNRRLYDTMHDMCWAATESKEMRITNWWSQTAWPTVWENLGKALVVWATKVAWYMVIQDILPTNVRLFRIRMVPTNVCRKCDRTDTRSDRLIECGEGEQIWTWTKQNLAWILRTIPERIPNDWLLRPHFTLWSARQRRAVLWVLVNLVTFRNL